MLVVGFVLAWLPYTLVSLLGALWERELTEPAAFAASTVLAKSSGCYNPLIYVCFSPSYRCSRRGSRISARGRAPRDR